MAMRPGVGDERELLDVRRAAAFVRRHPETVRRWIWSGRVPARRSGNRLLVARADLERVLGKGGRVPTLSEWAARAAAVRASSSTTPGQSASDLVIEDRAERQHR
jgi:hypothetical protein